MLAVGRVEARGVKGVVVWGQWTGIQCVDRFWVGTCRRVQMLDEDDAKGSAVGGGDDDDDGDDGDDDVCVASAPSFCGFWTDSCYCYCYYSFHLFLLFHQCLRSLPPLDFLLFHPSPCASSLCAIYVRVSDFLGEQKAASGIGTGSPPKRQVG